MAPVAPSQFFRTALPPRSSSLPAPPAAAPNRPSSPPSATTRAPQNFLSSSPPVSPAQSPPAYTVARQSTISCSKCSPPQSGSTPPQSAQYPAPPFPPDEYQKLFPYSSAHQKP